MTINLRQQAQALIRARKFAEAKPLVAKICEQSPQDAEAWGLRAGLHAALGEYAECEACCRTIIARQPNTPGTWYNLGNALSFQKKYDEAESAYRRAILISPAFADAHNNLGNVLREKKQLTEAEQCYREALVRRPDYASALANLGAVLYETQRVAEARGFFEHALRIAPDNTTALFGRGRTLIEGGDFRAGQECYERLVALDPGNAKAWAALGSVCAQCKLHDKGIAACHRAIALQPDIADAWLSLGFMHQTLGQKDEAEKMYREALRLDPGMTSARYFLAAIGRETAPDQTPAEYVKSVFDEYAERFDAHLVGALEYRTPELLEAVVRRILEDNAFGLDVLDLGCGTGLGGARFRGLARRLVGVDLSPKMVTKARERGVYDDLIVGDVMEPLRDRAAAYDLVIATDVFVYIGDLGEITHAVSVALRSGGLFAFSTETDDSVRDFTLRVSGRYAHARSYLTALAQREGFELLAAEGAIIRKDAGGPIHGHIHVFRKILSSSFPAGDNG